MPWAIARFGYVLSFSPVATMRSLPSGTGRCGSRAASVSAESNGRPPPGVGRMTGMALGWDRRYDRVGLRCCCVSI
jgi:hypothetical protein